MWEDDNTKKPLLEGKDKVEAKRGPDEKRSCNDILFMILFIACCVAFGVIAMVGFHKGDPKQLISSHTNEWEEHFAEDQVQGGFTNAVAQLKQDADVLAGSVAIAIVLGFIWIELMKKFTKLFIYGTLFAGVAAVVALGAYVESFGAAKNNQDVRIIGFVILGLAVILLLAVVFLRNKINLTAAMFTECCRGVQSNIALFPVLATVMSVFIGFAALWVGAFIYLWSIPDSTVDVTVGDAPKFNESVRSLMLFQVFAFLWITCFLSAVYQHVVAGAVAGWYFSRDMSAQRPKGPFAVTSLFHAVTTSFGSLAFGSLILAFVQFLSVLLKMIQKQNYKNRVMVAVVGCLQCLVSCIEGIVKYVNKFAYIYVAMHGYSFCNAARECFDLISRNFFNAVIMDTIGGFVLFVGQILFTAITTMITIGMLDGLGRVISPVTITLVAVFSFAVLHILSQVIAVGVDTVFVCYLEDLELNKGDNLYISPDLHNLLQERCEKYKNADGTKA